MHDKTVAGQVPLPDGPIRRITRVLGRLYISIPFLFFLVSCAGVPDVRDSSSSRLIENVPFHPQESYQCGPASLAGVLNYWHVEVSPENIAEGIYSESAGGTLDFDMVLYARQQGLEVSQYKGDFADIKRNIDWGYPVIVLVDYGFWIYQQYHYMVVVGYNENGIVVNSGRERLKFISLTDFLKSWEKTEFWTMLIVSKH